MFRSLTGTIGAALLGGAALLAPSQEQTPAKPAALARSAAAPGVVEQECYNEYVTVVQTAGRDHGVECWLDRVGCRTANDDCMAIGAEHRTRPFIEPE